MKHTTHARVQAPSSLPRTFIASNEPEAGFEASAGSATGTAQSEAYSRRVRVDNLRHALLPAIKKPPPAFKEVLK